MKTAIFLLPAHLACYLVNGDASGYEESDINEIDAFCARHNLGHCIDVNENAGFCLESDLNKLGGDMAHFTFEVLDK